MAKAVRSLSPKQIQERIQRHRHAVLVLARPEIQASLTKILARFKEQKKKKEGR